MPLSGSDAFERLVGFASQTSIQPPRFLIGLSKRNHTYRVGRDADHLAVHMLSREHADVARFFGGQTGDEVDKFDRCGWHAGPEDVPILEDAVAWFVGQAPESFGDLITFADVADIEPGHEA